MSVTLSITLDKRRVKGKTNLYPVKLLVVHDSNPKRYQTIYDLSEKDFKNLAAARVTDRLHQIRLKLQEIERTGTDLALKLEPFQWQDFEKEFILENSEFKQRKSIKAIPEKVHFESYGIEYDRRFPIFNLPPAEEGTLLATFLAYIHKVLGEGRIRTAASYQTTYRTMVRFQGNVKLSQIDVKYLKQLELWMLNQEYSITTVGIYTRCLRAIFNEAISEGKLKREKSYPFGRRKYQCPASRNVKKSLTIAEVEKIYKYIPENEFERKAKDFWLFSYLGNGINATDIAHLKYKNIDGDYITFRRSKTENAARIAPRDITFYMTEDVKHVIAYWANDDRSANNYLFPILKHGITPLRQVELIELFVQSINDWMKKIKTKLAIEKRVTTYVARHTFSTILKRSGVSTEVIQESLGHTNIRTTESYLDSFEKEIKKEFAAKLTAFRKEFSD